MSDMNPVPRPPALFDGRGARVLALVGVAILVAVLKPWGSPSTGAPSASLAVVITPVPTPTPTPTPDPADAFSRAYDPLVFGDRELERSWGLWPAGYLTTLGFAMRAEPTNPSEPPSTQPSPSPVSPADSPAWPDAISIPVGNHLLLIGVDTPLGFTVEGIALSRYLVDGHTEKVPVVIPPSPWPSHFTVIAIDDGFGTRRMAFWPPGRYRLDLTIDPGRIERSIEVRVEGSAPTPSAPASGAAD